MNGYFLQMPRKNPLPETERAICNRLKVHRRRALLSRVALAQLIGVDSNLLSSVENHRTPLRYSLAFKINSKIPLNPAWLATETGDPNLDFPLPAPEELGLDDRALFSQVYNESLRERFEVMKKADEELRHSLREKAGRIVVRGARDRLLILERLRHYVNDFAERVSDAHLAAFVEDAINYIDDRADYYMDRSEESPDVQRKRQAEVARLRPILERWFQGKIDVDVAATCGKLEAMKEQWPGLLERLKSATKARGVASALARELGVPLASVSRWLNAKREPSGEIALKLLHWVEQREAK